MLGPKSKRVGGNSEIGKGPIALVQNRVQIFAEQRHPVAHSGEQRREVAGASSPEVTADR